MLERLFHLRKNETTVRRELLAGLTTFMTMGYVVVVNPRILSEAGMPVEGVLFATCISAAIATLIMGLWANYPIALAPGMSLNAYFTYSIVLGRGVPWQTALGVVFLIGLRVSAAHADESPRTNRERDSRLPEARHGRRNWSFYRVRGLPKRGNYCGESGDVRGAGQDIRSASASRGIWA